jgi:hypothetical protein
LAEEDFARVAAKRRTYAETLRKAECAGCPKRDSPLRRHGEHKGKI